MNYLLLLLILVAIIPSLLLPRNNDLEQEIIRHKQKGRKRKMPLELLKEFVGKECSIVLVGGGFGVDGTIVAVEENWIKVEEKNRTRLINGDMIREISVMKEKNK